MKDYETLKRSTLPENSDPLIIELVFDTSQSQGSVRDRVFDALPGTNVEAQAVFDAEADRFHFISFPDIDPHGQEPQIFAFARSLRVQLKGGRSQPRPARQPVWRRACGQRELIRLLRNPARQFATLRMAPSTSENAIGLGSNPRAR